MTPRPPREWPRPPEDTNEWDREDNDEKSSREPNIDLGNEFDFRVENNYNPAILELSSGNQEIFMCPFHGNVSETIRFNIDGESEEYCMRCWREWFRTTPGMTRLERSAT